MSNENVKPWEPVSGYWVDPEDPMELRTCSWPWDWSINDCARVRSDQALRVTLANGQTVIVRAKG